MKKKFRKTFSFIELFDYYLQFHSVCYASFGKWLGQIDTKN